MDSDKRDLYAILGVRPDASQAQIRAAFRRVARRLHPDINGEPEATQDYKRAAAAYNVLRDLRRRASYDLGRGVRAQDPAGFDGSQSSPAATRPRGSQRHGGQPAEGPRHQYASSERKAADTARSAAAGTRAHWKGASSHEVPWHRRNSLWYAIIVLLIATVMAWLLRPQITQFIVTSVLAMAIVLFLPTVWLRIGIRELVEWRTDASRRLFGGVNNPLLACALICGGILWYGVVVWGAIGLVREGYWNGHQEAGGRIGYNHQPEVALGDVAEEPEEQRPDAFGPADWEEATDESPAIPSLGQERSEGTGVSVSTVSEPGTTLERLNREHFTQQAEAEGVPVSPDMDSTAILSALNREHFRQQAEAEGIPVSSDMDSTDILNALNREHLRQQAEAKGIRVSSDMDSTDILSALNREHFREQAEAKGIPVSPDMDSADILNALNREYFREQAEARGIPVSPDMDSTEILNALNRDLLAETESISGRRAVTRRPR